MMTRYAVGHPRIWWSLWGAAWVAGVALVAYLWHWDSNDSDRIAFVAAAMSLMGLVIAAFALKWTREAAVIADRSLRAGILYEELQRFEWIYRVVHDCATAAPAKSATRLTAALGPLTEKKMPNTSALRTSCQNGSAPSKLIADAILEVTDALDAKNKERASLTAR
jgi:hypothetical protein